MAAPTHRRSRPARRTAALVAAAVASVALAACTRDQGARPPAATADDAPPSTTTTSTTTTRSPATPGPSTTTTTVDPAAALELAWVRQVGGPGGDDLAAVTGRDDSVVAVGSTDGAPAPTAGGRDALVAVVGTDGTVRSVRQDGSSGTDRAAGVAVDASTTLACGTSDGDLGPRSGGTSDGWCATVDTAGRPGAPATLGGSGEDELVAVAAPPAVAGGIARPGAFAVGATDGIVPGAEDPLARGLGDGDALAVRLDERGDAVWVRQFGSFGADRATGVAATPDGDAVVVGVTTGNAGGRSAGGTDGFAVRFDPGGNARWFTQVGSPGEDRLSTVAVAGEARRGTERFVVGGATTGTLGSRSAGGDDALLVALGPDRTPLWTTQWGSTGNDRVTASVADGATLLVAGTTDGPVGTLREDLGPGGGSDAFVSAVDLATGEVQWTVRFGTAAADEVTGLTTTEDGLLVVAGTTAGQLTGAVTAGGTDGFLVAFTLPGGGGGAASSV